MAGSGNDPTSLILGGGGAIGGLIGDLFAQGKEDEARAILEQALLETGQLDVPTLLEYQAKLQGKTNLAGVTENQRGQDAQMAALDALMRRAETQGLSPQEAAMLSEARGEAESFAKGREGAIGQSMQARGMGDSGLSYVLQQQAAQEQAQRLGQSATQAAGLAAERALDARMKSGQLGGEVREQDWQHKTQVAGAQDSIDKFNTELTNEGAKYRDAQKEATFGMEAQKQGMRNTLHGARFNKAEDDADEIRRRGYAGGKAVGAVASIPFGGG